jgi:polyhydroxyalkanoate synthesis regulator phasin
LAFTHGRRFKAFSSPEDEIQQTKGRTMFDVLKEAVFTSVGLASLTREKVEQLAAEVGRRAKLSEQDLKAFQTELAIRTDQARQDFQTEIDRRIDHAFIQLGIIKAGVKREGEAARQQLSTAIDKRVEEAIQRLGVARADDLQALTIRFEALERKLSAK